MGASGSKRRRRAGAFAAIAAIALGTGVSTAAAGSSGRFVLAASGKVGDTSWQVGMARIQGERCFGLVTVRDGWEADSKACGRSWPIAEWSRILGHAGDGSGSIELEITSPKVRSLRLLLGDPGRRGDTAPATWTQLNTHVLNERQAKKSHLPRDFRFAVVTAPEDFCVEAVETLDRTGGLLKSQTVPCEG